MVQPASPPSANVAPAAAPRLLHRIAVIIYEGVLLFGVVVGVGAVFFAVSGSPGSLSAGRRLALQAVLFAAIGVYFVYCWVRGGQTLAMRSWGVRLARADGGPLTIGQAVLRYLLAWHLLAPGLLFMWLVPADALMDAVALALGIAAMLALAYTDPQRQLLHDRWLGTRVLKA